MTDINTYIYTTVLYFLKNKGEECTTFSLCGEHHDGLWCLQIVNNSISCVIGRHHMSWITPIKIDRCGNTMIWKTGDGKKWVANTSIDYWTPHKRCIALTSVWVKCAETRGLLLRVPQLDRPISWTGEQAVFDSAVSQSPHCVTVTQQRASQHAGIWVKTEHISEPNIEKILAIKQVWVLSKGNRDLIFSPYVS